uniref:Metallothionein n=1 Tax=Oxya chinensis TaxID=165482 RepID=X2KTP2_9ORTH|nr:metallothionein [Oxya chinensis]
MPDPCCGTGSPCQGAGCKCGASCTCTNCACGTKGSGTTSK